jgi:hypothetical protein
MVGRRVPVPSTNHRLPAVAQSLDKQSLARAGSYREQRRERRGEPEQIGWAWWGCPRVFP